MIERKTVLDQAEMSRDGVLGVRLCFLLVEDGVEIDKKLHRTTIPLNVDPVQQMLYVNAHIVSMEPPMPPVSQPDVDRIVAAHVLLRSWFGI